MYWTISQFFVNSVQLFQRRSWKRLSQPEAWVAILVFLLAPKHKLDGGCCNVASYSIELCWILFNSFRKEVKNVSANMRLWRPSWFSDQPDKHKFGRRRRDLASYIWICEKLTTDRRRVEGQTTTRELSCTKYDHLTTLQGIHRWNLNTQLLLVQKFWLRLHFFLRKYFKAKDTLSKNNGSIPRNACVACET